MDETKKLPYICINNVKKPIEHENLLKVNVNGDRLFFQIEKNGVVWFSDVNIYQNNYFSLDVRTGQPLKFKLLYRLKDTQENREEDFFIMNKQEDQKFRMILDPFGKEKGERVIYGLEIQNLKEERAKVEIAGIDFSAGSKLPDFEYMENVV